MHQYARPQSGPTQTASAELAYINFWQSRFAKLALARV
jgi:hypothetical protein